MDESLFEKVEMPSYKCFLKELEEWQQNNNFPKGVQFYKYPETLQDGNRMLQRALPEIHLIKDGGKFKVDVEKFAEKLSSSEEK